MQHRILMTTGYSSRHAAEERPDRSAGHAGIASVATRARYIIGEPHMVGKELI